MLFSESSTNLSKPYTANTLPAGYISPMTFSSVAYCNFRLDEPCTQNYARHNLQLTAWRRTSDSHRLASLASPIPVSVAGVISPCINRKVIGGKCYSFWIHHQWSNVEMRLGIVIHVKIFSFIQKEIADGCCILADPLLY